MIKIHIFFKYCLVPLVLTFCWQTTKGQSVFGFLELPASPHQAALSGPVVSLPDANPSLIYANPAYADSSHHKFIALNLSNHFADASFSVATGSWYLPKYGTLTAGLRFMNYGVFDRIDVNGIDQGEFRSYDMAVTFGISRSILPNLSVGVTTDFIYGTIDAFSSSAVSFSAGVLYVIPEKMMSLGFTIANLGHQLSAFEDTYEPLPLDIRAGFTQKLRYVPLRYSLTLNQLHNWDLQTVYDDEDLPFLTNALRHVTVSGEFLFSDHFILHLGFNKWLNDAINSGNRLDFSGFSLGVSIHTKYASVQLSRSSYSNLGPITQIGLSSTF